MGFLEHKKDRDEARERIEAENRLWEARVKLLDSYVKGAREIVEHHGYEFTEMNEQVFRTLMTTAIDAGYDPSAIGDMVNSASRVLANMGELPHAEGGKVFCSLVKNDLSRGFHLDVLQS